MKIELPDAAEKISWSMPTYWQGNNIIHFAAAKIHIGLYPGPAAVEQFAERLEEAVFCPTRLRQSTLYSGRGD